MKVLVLGAGLAGVASAWYLAQAGHEVTVLERGASAGLETSFANGGQISAGHAEPWASPGVLFKVLRWLGREDAPLLFRMRADPAQWAWSLRFLRECTPGRFARNTRNLAGLALYSRACLAELRAATGIEYDQQTRGILHFATSEAEFDALAAQADAMSAYGIRRLVKTTAECLDIEPALRASSLPIRGGIHTPGDESGDAHAFTIGLAALAMEQGVDFRFGSVVERIVVETGAFRGVRDTGGQVHRADACVVCLGSYSPRLLRPLGLHIPVFPLKGYSVTVPLRTALERAGAATVSLTDEAAKLVFSRLGDRLRAAGTAELAGYDTSINAVRCEAILARVRALFPALEGMNGVQFWAGLRPATPSNAPLIGRSRVAGLYLNTGHGTLGWTLACGSGRALADIVSGRRPEPDFAFT